MKHLFCFLLLAITSFSSYSQTPKRDSIKEDREIVSNDTLAKGKLQGHSKLSEKPEATIEMYKIISHKNDTTIVDTTLTIQKDYKFNYLRRDNFGLMPFANLGQTYNELTQDFSSIKSLPVFGARARHFNYMEVEDTYYYQVPTPFTELFYKTAFQQGQLLDAFFTVNTSKQFNASIAYKGLRSLGKYQNILTSTGNFRFTTNYITKNKKYQIKAHMVSQDLLNNENGGLTKIDIENFESGNPNFIDRSAFDPNFEDAQSTLVGKRYYLDHKYQLTKPSDSLQLNSLYIGNVLMLENKYYHFTQKKANSYFGEAFLANTISDKVRLQEILARGYVEFNNNILGEISLKADFNRFNYGYNTVVFLEGQSISNRLKGHNVVLGGTYKKQINKVQLEADLGVNVEGEFSGNFLKAEAAFNINSDNAVKASLNTNSRRPNYNYLLYQSGYLNYNWNNASNFKNIKTQQLAFQLRSNKILNLQADYNTISNYTYFAKNTDASLVKPYQTNRSINYYRIKLNKEIKFGRFALDNTLLYQNVIDGEGILNVPDLITRNTFYYSNHIFKKALYLQTGITFNYFTKYHMDGYDPLLAEFYTQNNTQVGNFPRLDFFLNAKVRQTRIYFKAEHFNAPFTGYNYYSAPGHPYRDFTVRFGLVWNFFL